MLETLVSPNQRDEMDLVHICTDSVQPGFWMVSLNRQGNMDAQGTYANLDNAVNAGWELATKLELPLYLENEDDYNSTQLARLESSKCFVFGTLEEIVDWQCEHQGTFASISYAGTTINVDNIKFDKEEMHKTIANVIKTIQKEINHA